MPLKEVGTDFPHNKIKFGVQQAPGSYTNPGVWPMTTDMQYKRIAALYLTGFLITCSHHIHIRHLLKQKHCVM